MSVTFGLQRSLASLLVECRMYKKMVLCDFVPGDQDFGEEHSEGSRILAYCWIRDRSRVDYVISHTEEQGV